MGLKFFLMRPSDYKRVTFFGLDFCWHNDNDYADTEYYAWFVFMCCAVRASWVRPSKRAHTCCEKLVVR